MDTRDPAGADVSAQHSLTDQTNNHSSAREDHDSPWKEALEVFFRPFMDEKPLFYFFKSMLLLKMANMLMNI